MNIRQSLLLSLFLVVAILVISGCSVASQADTATKDLENQTTQTTATPSTTTTQVTKPQTTTSTGPAVFSLSNMVIEPRDIATDSLFSISVIITNTGGSQGNYDAVLYIDEVLINLEITKITPAETITKNVTVGAGNSEEIIFDSLSLHEGLYTVAVGGLKDYIEVGC
jgi:hypothetical protein